MHLNDQNIKRENIKCLLCIGSVHYKATDGR